MPSYRYTATITVLFRMKTPSRSNIAVEKTDDEICINSVFHTYNLHEKEALI